MSRNRYLAGGIAVAIVFAAIGGYWLTRPAAQTRDDGRAPNFAILSSDRTLGSPKAPVTVIEYAAPSCPVCARFNAEVFPLLKQNYIDTGKIYYVFRTFPLRDADGAAEGIARCLPTDRYFPFIDLLFRNQAQWDPEFGITDVHGALLQMARIAGMDQPQADKCMADKAQAQRVNQVAQDAVTRYAVDGTPTFVINGTPQPAGFIPWSSLEEKLNAFRQKAGH